MFNIFKKDFNKFTHVIKKLIDRIDLVEEAYSILAKDSYKLYNKLEVLERVILDQEKLIAKLNTKEVKKGATKKIK